MFFVPVSFTLGTQGSLFFNGIIMGFILMNYVTLFFISIISIISMIIIICQASIHSCVMKQ